MEIEFRSCLYFTVTRLSRMMEEAAVRSFWGVGFTPSQALIQLYIIEHPGSTVTRVAEAMHLPASSIERYVDQLQALRHSVRQGEGPAQTVFPTESGKELGPRLRECWKNLYAQLCDELGGEEAYRHLLMAVGEVLEIRGRSKKD